VYQRISPRAKCSLGHVTRMVGNGCVPVGGGVEPDFVTAGGLAVKLEAVFSYGGIPRTDPFRLRLRWCNSAAHLHRETSGCRYASRRRKADNMSAPDYKVIAPRVCTGIKQCDHGACAGIDACKIRPLVSVAAVTGEGQSAGIIGTSVLP
jgi:hypothetical protein